MGRGERIFKIFDMLQKRKSQVELCHSHNIAPSTNSFKMKKYLRKIWVRVFSRINLSVTDQWTDGPTDQWMNKASYEIVSPQL